MQSDEVARYAALLGVDGASDAASLRLGLQFAIAGLLASPNFIYLPVVGEVDPMSGEHRYTGYEMASRLSYFLWNSTPDDALLDAAKNGGLASSAGVLAEATRMLQSPRGQDLLARFIGESWGLDKLAITSKSPDAFPKWTPALLSAYQTEVSMFLGDLLSGDKDLSQLFSARESFLNDQLAQAYGVSAASGSDFAKAALDPTRAGIVTSGAVMAAVSPTDRTSPTRRGVFVLERLLCQEVPAPPPNVKTTFDPPAPGQAVSLRDQLAQHRTDPACAGCHAVMDPVGLTFEEFDGIGLGRTLDNGAPVDSSGGFQGVSFADARQLADWLASEPRVASCFANQIYRFAGAHVVAAGEQPIVDDLAKRAQSDFRFSTLVANTVASKGFRYLTEAP
jgi:hypothetical protein